MNERPLSIVTEIHCVSAIGWPLASRMAPKFACEYTRTGFAGSRHHSTKSRSWVASIAAGESLTRPLIFLPRPRVMWRGTRALPRFPIKALGDDRGPEGQVGFDCWGEAKGEFHLFFGGGRVNSTAFHSAP